MTYLVSSDAQKFKVDNKSNSSAKLHERIDLSFILDKIDSTCTIINHSLVLFKYNREIAHFYFPVSFPICYMETTLVDC